MLMLRWGFVSSCLFQLLLLALRRGKRRGARRDRRRMKMKALACCRRRPQDLSIDMDQEPDRVMTYNGLETCIINCSAYDDDSGISATTCGDGCVTADSLDDEVSSCFSKDASGSSFSSHCLSKQEEHSLDELGTPIAIHLLPFKAKKPITYTLSASDIENMKKKFAKLLLGYDTSGGARGVCAALALSNGIINLSATVFGELWKLEPLCEDKKIRWRKEMDWLMSPTTYIVELVPRKQSGADGCTFEIMTPKARSDVHVNLPALQKLDTMLIEVMDSMIDTEFWYEESGSRADGPSGRASLGEDLYQAITTEYIPIEEIFVSLSLKTEHSVLETMNQLEGAMFAWNQRILEERSKRSPGRHSWSFMKDSSSELDKMSACIERVDTLVQLLKARYPNLPPTFIDVLKVQYNVDVGNAIVEAYSRVLVGVAFSILSRVAEILLEDDLVKRPNTPMASLKFDLSSDVYLAGITETPPGHVRRSLMDQISMVDGRFNAAVKKKGAKQLRW
ncbi:Rop guanine nucleotide exchange factor 14 [Zea mays]|uniref:Rop guanine nucleotide exchange factor 14 n=1 Tax=Zea mays TaxID=4577 RepID=A0A1D6Q7Y1_MAIZE|nr:Rop guanine nucleotide exchange factor 14 [Zea mays]